MPFHIGIPLLGRDASLGFHLLNINEETLLDYFVKPYRAGEVITWQGTWIQPNQPIRERDMSTYTMII